MSERLLQATQRPEIGPGRYYICGIAIHEGPGLEYPIALDGTALLSCGGTVEIDEITSGSWGHLKDQRGYVLLEQLSRMA